MEHNWALLSKINTFEENFQKLRSEMEILRQEKKTILQNIHKANIEKESLQQEIIIHTNENQNLQQENQTFEEYNKAIQNEIQLLQKKCTKWQKDKSKLEDGQKKLEEEIIGLKSTNKKKRKKKS